jgi:glucan-binding YG repeat protein
MKKRVLSWLLAIAVTAGTLMPSNLALAAEASELTTPVAEAGDTLAGEADELSDAEDVTDEESAETALKAADDAADEALTGDGDEDAEDAEDAETAEEETVAEAEASDASEVLEEDELPAADVIEADLTFEVSDVDLMYGESSDNKDGHLDALFAPAVTGEDGVSYELKSDESAEDALTFETSYKFIADAKAFDVADSSFAELTDEEKADEFKALEEADLAKAAAGTELYAAVKAVASDGKTAYAVSKVNIVKRPVVLEFPATEEISVSADTYPEDGIIVVPAGSELLEGAYVNVLDEYTLTVDEKELVVKGASKEDLSGIPSASEFITGDITLDVSEFDLQVSGYQPAPASFELSEELVANFDVADDSTWPVLVEATDVEDAEDLLGVPEKPVPVGYDDPSFSANKIGFIHHYDPADTDRMVGPGVTFESDRYGSDIKIEVYASRSADRTNPVKIGTRQGIQYELNHYEDNVYSTKLQKYYIANALPIDFSLLDEGEWYLFGRFYEVSGGYSDSVNTVTLSSLPMPVVATISDVSSADSHDADVSLECVGGDGRTMRYVRYGANDYETVEAKYVAGKYVYEISDLGAGRYFAFLAGTRNEYFCDEFYADSTPAEFFVYVKEPSVTGLEMVEYATKTVFPEGQEVGLYKGQTMRVFGRVLPVDALDSGVVYSSSDPKAVSVDAQGNIKGLVAGKSAVITIATHATMAGGKPMFEKHYNVTVEAAEAVKVKSAKFEKTKITAQLGKDMTVVVKAAYSANTKCETFWSVADSTVVRDYGSSEKEVDGWIAKEFVVSGPGQTTISLNIGGVKTISCTVCVNGSTGEDDPYFNNGKYLTGFVAFDASTSEVVATGNAALKKTGEVFIRYYDTVSHLPMGTGVTKIGNKLYYFDTHYNLVRGESNKDGKTQHGFVINKQGEVLTGWQKPDGSSDEYYFNTAYGYQVGMAWVPRGKGSTWVDSEGLMRDQVGDPLTVDGAHVVSGVRYWFKGGVRQSGLFYLDEDFQPTTAKKALNAAYFNSPNGENVENEFFYVNGKKYYAHEDGLIDVSRRFCDDDATDDWYYADATGAIVTGPKIVKDDKSSFYVDEEGMIAFSTYVNFGGRVYFCNDQGYVDDNGTGFLTNYYAHVGDEFTQLYMKFSNAKNPAAGTFFYSDAQCKKKVTNSWLYYGDDHQPYLYLDKNGKLASGFVKTVEGTTFFFDPEDSCMLSTADDNHIVSYKGNYYICTKDGVLVNGTTDFYKVYGSYYRVKNSSGVLMTGVQTIGGKRYAFNPEGRLAEPMFYDGMIGVMTAKGYEKYMANPDYGSGNPSTWYIYAPGKVYLYEYYFSGHTYRYIINKDGSLYKTGWVTLDGKKYYVLMGDLAPAGYMVKIGGKYYTFNEDNSMHTGWTVSDGRVKVIDVSDLSMKSYSGEFYFYFDPKSGVLQTGWKTMNTVRTNVYGEVVDSLGITGEGEKKKIYFNAVETSEMPIGALLRDTDYTVGGKLYRFAADGSIETGNEAFVETDPKAESFEGIDCYRKADGTLAKGRTLVETAYGNYYFYFNQNTGRKEVNALRKTGGKWYYYGDNGVMSTTLHVYTRDSEALAIFNADGSLKSFVARNGSGAAIKNTIIKMQISEVYYQLGSNGLPMTGLVDFPNEGIKILVEDDGAMGGNFSDMSKLRLRKVGSKYYMFVDGILLDRYGARAVDAGIATYTPAAGIIATMANDEVFEYLPESDKAEVARILKIAERMDKGFENYAFVFLNGDGSVRPGEVQTERGRFTANRLGLVVDYWVPFVKSGSGFRVAASIYEGTAGSITTKAYPYSDEESKTLVISWDENGNLLPIIDKATGKNANGLLMVDELGSLTINVKNGKLQTGKAKFSEGPYSFTITIEKDFGVAAYDFRE